MGRIRTVKPEFFKHEDLFDLEAQTQLPVRLAFIGLWTCADREGRFKWRPRSLKVDILPYDDCDFSRVLDALATRGFIVKYTSGTEEFGYIPSWKSHQYVNGKEPLSFLPEPPQVQTNHKVDACVTREARVNYASGTDGVKEGKGREGKEERGAVPDNLDELTEAIGHQHPANTHLEGRFLPLDQKQEIAEAIIRDGEALVLAGTRNLRDKVAVWPKSELRFIPNPVKFYHESDYLKDPVIWDRGNGHRGHKGNGNSGDERTQDNYEKLSRIVARSTAEEMAGSANDEHAGDVLVSEAE